jgi:hypothetical protein
MRTRLALALLFVLVAAETAQARREQVFRYPFSRVWGSALRMMRVDYESPITEKDMDSGYFLFTYAHDGKENQGSAELVRTMEGGVESVRVVIQVPALPTYIEQMMLDRLTRKLSQEHGDPVAPVKKKDPEEGAKPEAPSGGKGDKPQPPSPPIAPKQPAQ